MSRPQRHRLLHGYPMRPLMQPLPPSPNAPEATLDVDPARGLLVGVLPHTYCNPKVRGCGFCTFPHERHTNEGARESVASVVRELEQRVAATSSLRGRRVEGLYFGGGTANLTPPDAFEALSQALEAAFDLRDAELTLEGVPVYFLTHDRALLRALARTTARHRRLSMGVQTFDPAWLKKMGRERFGDRENVRAVVGAAREADMTVSIDLLINLPERSLPACLDDLARACELEPEQICLYNLVLAADLDAAWSEDEALLAKLPSPERAFARWLAARAFLLENGYVQTTLTNFELATVVGTPRAFLYERASFTPHLFDALGFGPAGISTMTARGGGRCVKWQNHDTAEAYQAAIAAHGQAAALRFTYTTLDQKLLHLTRSFAQLSVPRAPYRERFGVDLEDDFPEALAVLSEARLLDDSDPEALRLTPDGMFYADAVAGLLASERARQLAAPRHGGRDPNDSRRGSMG